MTETLAAPIAVRSSAFVPSELEGIPDPELVMLRPSELELDADVNRALDHSFVDKLEREFNKHALGAFSAWGRIVLDGQHRKVTCERVGYDEPRPTFVYSDITLAQSAELFLALNKTRNVHAIDKFRKAVQAEHADESAIAALLAEFNQVIGHGDDNVSCPGTLLMALRSNGIDVLGQIVATLYGAFYERDGVKALNRDIIAAVARVEKAYRKSDAPLDFEILGQVFAGVQTVDVLQAERDLEASRSAARRPSWHYAGVIVKFYNETAPKSLELAPWYYAS